MKAKKIVITLILTSCTVVFAIFLIDYSIMKASVNKPPAVSRFELTAGEWLVGEDIPVYRYELWATQPFEIEFNPFQQVLRILPAEEGAKKQKLTLMDGMRLHIDDSSNPETTYIFTPLHAYSLHKFYLRTGSHIVGQDIDPGDYEIYDSRADNGWLTIYDKAGLEIYKEYLQSEIFRTGAHWFRIPSLLDGQELKIEGLRNIKFRKIL